MSPFVVWFATVAGQALGPVHQPAIEAHLASLVGDWTRAGRESSYRDRCVWYDRHAFVVCSLTDSSSGLRVEAVVGYSEDEQRFTYESYGNDGTSHAQYGYALGSNGIVFTDERKVEGKPVRLTTTMVPQADGRLHLAQERSVMGSPWEKTGEVYYIKRK